MKLNILILATIPLLILSAVFSHAAVSVAGALSPKDLKPAAQPSIGREVIASEPLPEAQPARSPAPSLIELLANKSQSEIIESNVSCRDLDARLSESLDFFVYSSRLSGLRSVSSRPEAIRQVNSNIRWMSPAANSTRYLNQLSDHLATELFGSKLKDVDVESRRGVGFELLRPALGFCGLTTTFDDSLESLQVLDSEIARVFNLAK